MFDNVLVSHAADALGWDHHQLVRVNTAYEWCFLAMVTFGLYYCLIIYPKKLPKRISIAQVLLFTMVAGISVWLFSTEFRAYDRQREIIDKIELGGGSISMTYYSHIYSGIWYNRLIISSGVVCSICGAVFGLYRLVFNTRQITM